MSSYQQIQQDIEQGKKDLVLAQVQQALDEGLPAHEILQEGLIAAMDIVGAKMEREEMFIPEVLRAAKTMEAGLDLLRPHLAVGDLKVSGTVVIGTVKGDLHDIGKNLVAMLLASAGFRVVDAGINVTPDAFVEKVKESGADFLGMSALLTTTMPQMQETLKALNAAGLRAQVRVLVGGAPVTQSWADEIGADGYASDAGAAIKVAKELGAL
ncbi:MAG TPA: corrinoid protein [Thermoleophilia bacterium]|nr:corrinoid protein [Thermoleophilia bacterium]